MASSRPLDPPLTSRQGVTLRVLIICRISTEHQDPRSLADQEALLRRHVADCYDGPADVHVIASRGSGERLDRAELLAAEDRIERGEFDLVLAEDLGRVCRRNHAVGFCELCEDVDTRFIALNDQLDTGRPDWRMNALFAAFRHESANKDTALRIRRSLRHRFEKGGVVQTTIYGYVKPPGAKSDAELSKDPAAEAVYDAMFRRLEDGATFAEVADWLNAGGVSPGPYCRSGRWDVAMVARVVRNPILKGVRVRNKKMSRRVNKTGQHRSVAAPPEERLERVCPHLAFIDPERFDRVNALLVRRNAKYRRGKDGVDPRQGVAKKRTRWPGQHLHCGVCGRLYRYGGHGQTDHLMCAGAYEYACWNGATADGPLAARTLSGAVLDAIRALPDSDATFQAMVAAEVERLRAAQGGRLDELDARLAKLDRQLANVRSALREAGPSKALIDDLKQLEAGREQLLGERAELERVPRRVIAIPPPGELKRLALEALAGLAADAPEFGRLMKRLIPRIEVFPFRLCDGGRVVLRARFALDLVALVPDARALAGLADVLRRELVVDLFDPPQRVAYRERVLALKADGLTERQIATRLGITQPAVQRAAALNREMERRGLADPYVRLIEPPDDDGRLRRHRHPRYQFRPRPAASG
jgi:DNA invertase Pin-like site-specific DNA recombinase